MKIFLLLAISCIFALPVLSQNAGLNEGIVYKYYDKDWNELPFRDGAAYVRVLAGLNAIRARYDVAEYTARGVLLRRMGSSSKHHLIPDGPCTWYNNKQQPLKKGQYTKGVPVGQWTEFFDNGQMKEQYTYPQLRKDSIPDPPNFTIDNSWDSTGQAEVINGNGLYQQRDDTTGMVLSKGRVKNGQKDGVWLGFNKNGQRDYEEEYIDGEFIKGVSFSNGGTVIPYGELLEPPVFPGGEAQLSKFLARKLRYPRSAMENGVDGTVIVKFIVKTNGVISEADIDAEVESSLDAEAIRVVELMPAWTPGKRRGKIAPIMVRLPVRFRLIR